MPTIIMQRVEQRGVGFNIDLVNCFIREPVPFFCASANGKIFRQS